MDDSKDEELGPYVIPLSLDGREVLSFDTRRSSGWAAYFSDETEQARVHVLLKFGPCDYGTNVPLTIRELRFSAAWPSAYVGSTLLRSIPWERAEAAVNQPSRRAALAERVQMEFPFIGVIEPEWGDWARRPMPDPQPTPNLNLEIPEGYRKPDEFYADVAERFLQVSTFSSRPAQDLAEANDVKPTTVHRWIREAKARGVLALPRDRKSRTSEGDPE